MAYKIGIYMATRKGDELVENLPESYPTVEQAKEVCSAKNDEYGVTDVRHIHTGRLFAMYDQT